MGDGATRWLAFDHPGSPEPVGLLRVLPGGLVEFLDRDGDWHRDEGLPEALLASRTREVPGDEAERIATRLRARDVR
jgi:hypothetical protein